MPVTTANYIETIRAVVEQRLESLWIDGDDDPLTQIAWPSARFEPPSEAAWLELNILWGDSLPSAFCGDGGINNNFGVIVLKLFAPRGSGVGAQTTLIGTARTIFSNYFGQGLKCNPSSLSPIIREGSQESINISTRFEVYEFQSRV